MDKQAEKLRQDNLHLESRHKKVAILILNGYAKRAFLIQKISEEYPDWGVCERQIDNYIKAAREIIKNQYTEEDLLLEKDIALSRMDSLYTMNMKIQDYRECRNLIIDRMKLLGIAVEKTQNENTNFNIEVKPPNFDD
jgi:hypothetical protein